MKVKLKLKTTTRKQIHGKKQQRNVRNLIALHFHLGNKRTKH